jgi:acyl-CoA synthetase (AMP-forming)/AMP-acid ligase II
MGASRAGAVTSGVNPRLGAGEFRGIVAATHPRVVVSDGIGNRGDAAPPNAFALGRNDLDDVFSRGLRAPERDRSASDLVALVWTSGTTGMPKGAMFDHDNLRAVAAAQDVLTQRHDVYLSAIPFAHVGFTSKVWGHLAMRTTQVIAPAPWKAATALRLMEEHAVTVAGGVPAQWRLMLDHPDFDSADLSAVRQVVLGGAFIEPSLVHEIRDRVGCPVVARYTCTEAAVTTGTDPGAPDEVVAHTVGRAVTGVDVRLVGDDASIVPVGEVGEIECRSGAVMRGYWKDAAATAVSFHGEWLRTGDLGRFRSDGNLEIVGRRKEMYIRGGYNVYPAEVEATLAEHPGISASGVVGVPDPVLGEIGVAFVVPTDPGRVPDLEDVRLWCRERIADYKAPDRLQVIDELPLTSVHKTDKKALEAIAHEAGDNGQNGSR